MFLSWSDPFVIHRCRVILKIRKKSLESQDPGKEDPGKEGEKKVRKKVRSIDMAFNIK
jgi:hypothetical protein